MRNKGEVISVTSVRPSLTQDVEMRTRRYLVMMAFRTACFLLMLVIPNWPIRIALLTAALIVPIVAVLVANVGREKGVPPTTVGEESVDPSRYLTAKYSTPGGEYLR